MKECFYYLRDGLRRPVITVCLLKLAKHTKKNGVVIMSGSGNEVIVRGVAIYYSNGDKLCKKKGRDKAKGRALKAFVNKENGGRVIRDEAEAVLDSVIVSSLGSNYDKDNRYLSVEIMEKGKYIFNPVLTTGEKKLMEERVPTEATPETAVQDEPT